MPLYKPTELFNFLNDNGLKPKKCFSQNFLLDGNILKKIVATAEISSEDLILEIGPGPGALTEQILKHTSHIVTVEKDINFANLLSRLSPSLTIVQSDFLTLDLSALIHKKAKVIANIPYHLTAPILSHLFSFGHLFSSLTLMVQKEVADRMVALPKTKDYSAFSIFIQSQSYATKEFIVSSHCFYPKPKVQSAVVHLILKENKNQDAFFHFVRSSFQKRRKTMRTSLKEKYDSRFIDLCLEKLGCPLTVRPEELSIDQFKHLFSLLNIEEYSKN